MKLSLKLTLIFLLTLLGIYLFLDNILVVINHCAISKRTMFLYINYFPFVIILLSFFEIFKSKQKFQSSLSILLSILLLVIFVWFKTPPKEIKSKKIGHVEFTEKSENNEMQYYCEYDYDIVLRFHAENSALELELDKNKKSIVSSLKKFTIENCYKTELEIEINEKFLKKLNRNLKEGKIIEINLANLSSHNGANYK